KRKRFHAHDEADKARLGDMVEITSTRPISKTKRWRLVRIVAEAPRS
ncbi:MAG: uS17 family ribosomal protein, partial [Planctomycetota bacterium]